MRKSHKYLYMAIWSLICSILLTTSRNTDQRIAALFMLIQGFFLIKVISYRYEENNKETNQQDNKNN